MLSLPPLSIYHRLVSPSHTIQVLFIVAALYIHVNPFDVHTYIQISIFEAKILDNVKSNI